MSKQGSNHDFPEVDEDSDVFDPPSREQQEWEEGEWGIVDPSWPLFVGEDKDLEVEDDDQDEPDWYDDDRAFDFDDDEHGYRSGLMW